MAKCNQLTSLPFKGLKYSASLSHADKLSVSVHVAEVVPKCAQSLHVIRVLRRHGTNDQALQAIYRSVILAKLLHTRAVPGGASRRRMIDIASKLSFVVESGLV